MDGRVYAFLAMMCATTMVLVGLAPALQVSTTDVNDVLKEGGHAGVLVLRKQDNQRTVIQIACVRGFLSAFILNTESRAPVEISRGIIGKKVQFTLLTWCETERASTPRTEDDTGRSY
jgi:hypothetical protein